MIIYVLFGFGFSNLIFGKIVLFSRATIDLIMLAMAEPPSPWLFYNHGSALLIQDERVSNFEAHLDNCKKKENLKGP
jgi:hypothetical protein